MYGRTTTAAGGILPVTGLALDLAWIALAAVMLLVVGGALWRLAPRVGR